MENGCMATMKDAQKSLCRNDEKLYWWKGQAAFRSRKDNNGEEVFGEMLDDMLSYQKWLTGDYFYLRKRKGWRSERMLDMLLTSILSKVDEISHKWEVYKRQSELKKTQQGDGEIAGAWI